MLKKLTDEQRSDILEAAVDIFGEKGYAAAGISEIAKAASVSVGVIYKYYTDKAALFSACVDRSLVFLNQTLGSVEELGGSLIDMIRNLIRANISFAKTHPNYIRMYHTITCAESDDMAQIVSRIEGEAAHIYSEMISKAKSDGTIREDIVPEDFAFFFDNLMMILHFSYACGYYKERMKLYCGSEACEDSYDKHVEEQLTRFITGALGMKE